MSETIIDYDKVNKFLPQSLRNFVGATNRISRENYQEFLTMFSGIELLAVMNNLVSAEYASGYSQFNLTYMRSGIPPKLLDIKVSKAVGKVYYQTNGDEKAMNEKFDSFYFSNMLYKASEQSCQTGRSVMVVYGDFDNQEAHLECYNLFRHRIVYGKKKEVKEASLFITRLESDRVGCEYTIEEHRFYKEKNNDDGTKSFIPMQEFLVNKVMYEHESKNDAKVYKMDVVPEEIQKTFENIKFNEPRELKGFTSIGVFPINHSKTNKKFPDLEIPEAMFVDAVDNALMVETSITDKEVEKEVGRAQIMLPQLGMQNQIGGYMSQEMAGTMMRTVPVGYKNPIITPYPTNSIEDSKPTNIQFDIRSEQWENSINGDVARLCASVGISVLDYDPRLLQTGQRTDDEINAMTDITANTVQAFRNLNTYEINKCLECVGALLGIEAPISIRWSMASILNPTKNADLVTKLLTNGLISRKEAIRRANPDLTDNEVDEMMKEIDSEQDSRAVPMAFNNF